MRPDAATIKAKRAEIRRRYARGKPKFSLATRIIRDTQAFYADTYGDTLPDDDVGRDRALIMAHHLANAHDDARRSIPQWLEAWAPWMSIAEARTMIGNVIARPKRWKADKLGWRLGLTDAVRTRLGITTIGSTDVGRTERAERREQRKYQRKLEHRRRQGVLERAQYEATSTASAKPWQALGISRRTWYRRGKPRGTGLSPSI